MSLHGNNIIDVKGNFISFKQEKKFSSHSCTFLVKVLKNPKFLTLYFFKTIFLVFFQRFFDFNAEIFKLNDRLDHLLFCLILGKEFSKVNISKTVCPILKIFDVT